MYIDFSRIAKVDLPEGIMELAWRPLKELKEAGEMTAECYKIELS